MITGRAPPRIASAARRRMAASPRIRGTVQNPFLEELFRIIVGLRLNVLRQRQGDGAGLRR